MFAVPVGSNELELFPSSRPVVEHDKLCYAVDDLKRLSNCDLTIQDSDDPERPINFEPRVPEGDVGPVGDDIAVESESDDPELIPDKGSDPMDLIIPEGLPQPDLDLPDLDDEGDTRMDEGVGSEAMEVDSFLVDELMAASLNQVYTGPDLRTVSKEVDRSFTLLFCGARITCVVPKTAVSETSGEHLEPKLLETAMSLELEELESFRVGKVITEQEAKVFAKRNGRRVLTSRWVNTVKRPGLYRARLVVRDFAGLLSVLSFKFHSSNLGPPRNQSRSGFLIFHQPNIGLNIRHSPQSSSGPLLRRHLREVLLFAGRGALAEVRGSCDATN